MGFQMGGCNNPEARIQSVLDKWWDDEGQRDKETREIWVGRSEERGDEGPRDGAWEEGKPAQATIINIIILRRRRTAEGTLAPGFISWAAERLCPHKPDRTRQVCSKPLYQEARSAVLGGPKQAFSRQTWSRMATSKSNWAREF